MALESGIVVDAGQTVVLEGLRVCASERGQGVAGVIQRFADSYMKKLYPSLKFKRLTRADDPGPEKLSKFRLLAKRVSATALCMCSIWTLAKLVIHYCICDECK